MDAGLHLISYLKRRLLLGGFLSVCVSCTCKEVLQRAAASPLLIAEYGSFWPDRFPVD